MVTKVKILFIGLPKGCTGFPCAMSMFTFLHLNHFYKINLNSLAKIRYFWHFFCKNGVNYTPTEKVGEKSVR